jgi:hypothetical protein
MLLRAPIGAEVQTLVDPALSDWLPHVPRRNRTLGRSGLRKRRIGRAPWPADHPSTESSREEDQRNPPVDFSQGSGPRRPSPAERLAETGRSWVTAQRRRVRN